MSSIFYSSIIYPILFYHLFFLFLYISILCFDYVKEFVKKMFYLLKQILALFKNIFINIFSPYICIKLGYFYAKKEDNHYSAKLIAKLCNKYLSLNLNIGNVKHDLNYSTKFGRVFYYRKINGFLKGNSFFSLISYMSQFSGFLIFMHKTHSITFDLSKYVIHINDQYKDIFLLKFLSAKIPAALNYIPVEISALNAFEFVFIIGAIIRLFKIFFSSWVLPDRRSSILNVDEKNYFLIPKLSWNQKFWFRLGISIYNMSCRLSSTIQLIVGYFIMCQLELTSFIKNDNIFKLVDYILDYFIKCIFESEDEKVKRSFVRNIFISTSLIIWLAFMKNVDR